MCWRWRLWVIRRRVLSGFCDAIEEIDRRESLKYREEAVEKEPLKKRKNEADHADLPGYGCGE